MLFAIDEVKKYAINKHNETGCTYDGKPYEVHLQMVVDEATKHLDLNEDWWHGDGYQRTIINACWCHDLIEDCRVTFNDLVNSVGIRTANIVYSVTNELGKDRVERALKTYPKLITNPDGIFVKCCDRLANTKFSDTAGSTMYAKYRSEYPTFRYYLKNRLPISSIWDDLDDVNEFC